jgi:hypothetical protein
MLFQILGNHKSTGGGDNINSKIQKKISRRVLYTIIFFVMLAGIIQAETNEGINSLILALEDREHYSERLIFSGPDVDTIKKFPEVQELITIGNPAAEILVDKFKEPYHEEKDVALSSYAYILGELNYEPAAPVLAAFLKNNDYKEMKWTCHFTTHTLKILTSQSGIDNLYYTYSQEEIEETIRKAEQSISDGLGGLTFESRSKSTGGTVQIPLTLEGIQEKIGNMDLTLRYDPSVLEATDVIKGGLTAGSISDHNILSDGTVKVSLADSKGFSGDGSIAYVKFNVVGTEGTSSPLTIETLAANSASDYLVMDIPAIDGVFRVISVEDGRGDSDGNSELTALDALYALRMAVEKIPEDLAMDVNNDGSVTSLDARKILKIAVGSENK